MASTDSIVNYYVNLLILQYYTKPLARATIDANIRPLIMDQVFLDVQNSYGVDSAAGVQLDVLGKYVGASRTGYVNLNLITLNDDDFRKLIRLKIIRNNAGSSLATIQQLLTANFPGLIAVSDTASMLLNYTVLNSFGSSNLLALLVTGDYLPRPMGVEISISFINSFSDIYFGMRTYASSSTNGGFNTYDLINPNSKWRTYSN